MELEGKDFDYAIPIRRYISMVFVAAIVCATLCFIISTYLVVSAKGLSNEYLAVRSSAEAYQDKLPLELDRAGMTSRLRAFNDLLVKTRVVRSGGSDIRVLLNFLERNHPDGLLVRSLNHDARKGQALIELEAANEEVVRQYLNAIEEGGVFKTVVILKRASKGTSTLITSYKLEVGF